MESDEFDPNELYQVDFTLEQLSSSCRLCLLRNGYHPIVVVRVSNKSVPERFTYYCTACYEYLRLRAIEDVPTLPALNMLCLLPQTVSFPVYLIKKGSPFRLYFPRDDIDMGLLRKKRRDERDSRK